MSNSVWPHRWPPTRLLCSWDSPGKNNEVGCHFLLQCMKGKSESEATQLCLTLSDFMDCSLPGSSIHGIFQARVLALHYFFYIINFNFYLCRLISISCFLFLTFLRWIFSSFFFFGFTFKLWRHFGALNVPFSTVFRVLLISIKVDYFSLVSREIFLLTSFLWKLQVSIYVKRVDALLFLV